MSNADDQAINKSKLLGLPRPLAGAVIGVLGYLVILLPLKLLETNFVALSFLSLDVELLGRMTVGALSAFADFAMPETLSSIVSVIISAIPPAILGWLIGSYRRSIRITGIILLVIYLLLTLAIGTVLILMAI
jgi:hypothetical protein